MEFGKEIGPKDRFLRISQTSRELTYILHGANAVLASSSYSTHPHFNSNFALHEVIIGTHVKLMWYSIFESMKE